MAAKMDRKLNRKMEEHLLSVQRETKAALDGFKGSGFKVDKEFVDNFLKLSVDRMTQTCRYYAKEAESKTKNGFKIPKPVTMPLATNVSATIDLTASPLNKKKRISGDVSNVEQTKMSELIDFNLNSLHQYTAEEVPAINRSPIRNIVFYCVHCMNMDDSSKSVSGTIDDVYGHWLILHAKESISKPFQFYAFASIKCFYCGEVGIYNDLLQHHQKEHPSEELAVVDCIDASKCGICHSDENVLEHFYKSHRTASTLFNPIQYTEERIAELLSINVSRDPQCSRCMKIFSKQVDLLEHYASSHDGVASNADQLSHLVCGYCQKKVDHNWYVSHFKTHVYNFKCSSCEHQSVDLADLIVHETNAHGIYSLDYHCTQFPDWLASQSMATSLVFNNGLILQMKNAFDTKYDDSKLFNAHISEFVDLTKERVQHRIGKQQTGTTSATSTYDPSLMKELENQRKLSKNLYICGIARQFNDDLREIFRKLCQILEVNVSHDDIREIFQCKNGIIVKLDRIELKEMILNRMQNQNILTHHLFDLTDDRKQRKIQIHHQMTTFYRDIWLTAIKYKEQGTLHSFKLSGCGVVVRRNASDVEHIVQSKQQLIEFIEKGTGMDGPAEHPMF